MRNTLVLFVTAISFSACGGGGGGPATPSPTPTPPPSVPTSSACSALGVTAPSTAIVNGAECPAATSAVVLLNMRDRSGFAVGACSGVALVRVWLGSGDEIVASSFSFHPSYRPNSGSASDVGIVLMAQDIPRVPIPLLTSRDVRVGEEAVIAGWGPDQASVGATLRAGRTTVTAVGQGTIETLFSTTASSVCAGDSGGPILVSRGAGWAVAGVTSAASVLECNAGTNFYVNLRNASASSFVLNLVPNAGGI